MTRMSGGRAAAVVTVVLGCLVAAGCGGADDAGTQPKNGTTSKAASTPVEESSSSLGREFTADPTIVGAHAIPFTSWTKVADDRIAVNFQSGSPECYGVDATVRETDSTVTVELRSGSRADAVGRMCTMIAVFGTLNVPLQAPLKNRQVLSAAQ